MKTICTTSDGYRHLLPIFTHLFNKVLPEMEVTVLGYSEPLEPMPENFTFVSMGVQGHVSEWSTDIRKWVEAQPDQWFFWLMEDQLIKSVDMDLLDESCAMMMNGVGRIDLVGDLLKRTHNTYGGRFAYANPVTKYRLSTQPSIWNREFMLQYLTNGLTPWEFETQSTCDDYHIVSCIEPAIKHNEGVRKHDRFAVDLNGIEDDYINKIVEKWA